VKRLIKIIYRKLRDYLYGDPIEEMKKGGLRVGRNFNIQSGAIIDASHYWHISIGDDVTLAPRVLILAHDASTKRHLNYTKIGKVRIGNKVFVGAGTIILPGVSIGDNVVIGAGSIVSRSIPSNTVAMGNPARVICSIDDFLAKHRKQMEVYPCFGEEYTITRNVTPSMRQEMNEKMTDDIGYLV
jgi:maltose O-acetyltransferase